MRKASRCTRGVVNKSNEDGTWHRQTDTQKDEKDIASSFVASSDYTVNSNQQICETKRERSTRNFLLKLGSKSSQNVKKFLARTID